MLKITLMKEEKQAIIPEMTLSKGDLADEPAMNSGTRKVFFKDFEDIKVTPVFDGRNLHYGTVVHGPAIIEEPTTTIVVHPGYLAKVTKFNNYSIEKEQKL